MAVIDYARSGDTILWETVTGSDTGKPLYLNDGLGLTMSIQYLGTFGDTLTVQVSNDGTTWATAKDIHGTDVAVTAAGLSEMSVSAQWIRVSAGASITDVDVYVSFG